jgi:hypothetical protein
VRSLNLNLNWVSLKKRVSARRLGKGVKALVRRWGLGIKDVEI